MDTLVVENKDLLRAALNGLRNSPKTLESKWFYDAQGSALFEDITVLPEYYPTRTELSILRAEAGKLAKIVPEGAVLVELGSGASTKTRILLDNMTTLDAYVPLDISGDFLKSTSKALAEAYPALDVVPVVADFMDDISLPETLLDKPKVVFFPGSTIGNLDREQAIALLKRLRQLPNVAAFILGVDLVKSPEILVSAYDDAAGVTAAFNRNLLLRLNREVGAMFDVSQFRHEARWNDTFSRIEMHLVCTENQIVQVGTEKIVFHKGESIHTENSHKYTEASLSNMAFLGGWSLCECLTDPDNLFAVSILVPAKSRTA